MDRHEIDVSIVSTANPWLDFLSAPDAQKLASELNNDLEQYCSTSPRTSNCNYAIKRLYGFGLLPLVPKITTSAVLDIVNQIAQLPHLRGLIMGTRGIGKGLDDAALDPVWDAIEKAQLVVFLHPHYGVNAEVWGEENNGHVLPLALGFPFETTIVSSSPILSSSMLLNVAYRQQLVSSCRVCWTGSLRFDFFWLTRVGPCPHFLLDWPRALITIQS